MESPAGQPLGGGRRAYIRVGFTTASLRSRPPPAATPGGWCGCGVAGRAAAGGGCCAYIRVGFTTASLRSRPPPAATWAAGVVVWSPAGQPLAGDAVHTSV